MIKEYALDIDRPAFSPDQIDAGYQQLIAADRAYGGEVYDAVKQIPAFMRLVSAPLHSNMRPEFVEGVIEGVTSYFS